MYKHTNNDTIIRTTDGAFIPADAGNRDYREYLAWLEAGNVADPYMPPPTPIPTSVTMRQARLALLGAGMLGQINAALNALSDPTEKAAALIDWEYAATVERDSALVRNLAHALALTPAQLDQLFTTAGGF